MAVYAETKFVAPDSPPKRMSKSAWFKHSYAVGALLAIIIADFALRLACKWHPLDSYDSPNRSFIYWAANGYQAQKTAPDIVLMGSSLMMASLYGADATALRKPQSTLLHHRSYTLENDLKEKFQKDFRTYGLAIGGQNASDAYAIASTLFSTKKPNTIIYGIAPRDLMDSTLGSAACTETYRYLTHVHDIPDLAMSSRISIWERLDYIVEQISFIYGHRNDLLSLDTKARKFVISNLTTYKDLDNVYTPFYLRKIALTELPEDFGPNEVHVDPYNPNKDHYRDNSEEYRRRYATINIKMLDDQLKYLNRLGAFCHQQGINLILVNMPITHENLALLPKGIYSNYLDKIQTLSRSYNCNFLDLNRPDQFPKMLYADSVHLNGLGGQRFFSVLADDLFQTTNIAASLRNSKQ